MEKRLLNTAVAASCVLLLAGCAPAQAPTGGSDAGSAPEPIVLDQPDPAEEDADLDTTPTDPVTVEEGVDSEAPSVADLAQSGAEYLETLSPSEVAALSEALAQYDARQGIGSAPLSIPIPPIDDSGSTTLYITQDGRDIIAVLRGGGWTLSTLTHSVPGVNAPAAEPETHTPPVSTEQITDYSEIRRQQNGIYAEKIYTFSLTESNSGIPQDAILALEPAITTRFPACTQAAFLTGTLSSDGYGLSFTLLLYENLVEESYWIASWDGASWSFNPAQQ